MMTKQAFDGKAVLVTGSSRGIGLETARAFLDLGARVAINGRSEASVVEAAKDLGSEDRVHRVAGDLRSVAGCEAVVGKAIEALGRLDVLVNNAGIYRIASIEATDEALWDAVVDVDLKASFFCSRSAAAALRDSGGSIVNVASVNGLRGFEKASAYCAAKGGLVNLTRAMAVELAPEVRVNCVCPALVDTTMGRQNLDPEKDVAAAWEDLQGARPLQRVAAAAEVAAAIAYLASEDAKYITGTALPLDGGLTAGT